MDSYEDYLPTLRIQPTLAVSPDGKYLAYVDDALGQFDAVILPLTGGASRRLTSFTDKTVRRVAWHRSGRSLILLADTTGDEQTQVYLVDVDSGDLVALTNTPDVQYVLGIGDPVSPNGQLLAYAGNDRDPTDQDVLVRDLTTNDVRRVYRAGGQVFAGFWSPDGARLTAVEIHDDQSDHVVHLASPDGELSRRLSPTDRQATYWLGPWLRDGSGFVVRSNSGREFTGLAIMGADEGELTWLDTPDWDVEAVALAEDRQIILWSVNFDGRSQLRGRDLNAGVDLTVPTLPAGEVSGLAITADGRFAVLRLTTATVPPNFMVVDLDTGALRWLTDAKPAAADVTAFVEPALVRYTARDGREVPAYLYRPADMSGPTGVLLSIHGGPDHQERPVYDHLYQYLLRHGVAILVPNFRGSTGYGISNVRLIHRDWGGGDLDDFGGAVDYLRSQSWVDPERIALFGASYGGFAVLSCLARLPELGWAAAVDWCGPSNLVTLAELAPPTWRARVATMIGDPVADREFLLSRSPVTYVDEITAPLFIVQGANDPRVPKSESDQVVDRLRSRGVDVRYDVYPDEGHGFLRPENRTKAFSDTAQFLLAHLRKPATG